MAALAATVLATVPWPTSISTAQALGSGPAVTAQQAFDAAPKKQLVSVRSQRVLVARIDKQTRGGRLYFVNATDIAGLDRVNDPRTAYITSWKSVSGVSPVEPAVGAQVEWKSAFPVNGEYYCIDSDPHSRDAIYPHVCGSDYQRWNVGWVDCPGAGAFGFQNNLTLAVIEDFKGRRVIGCDTFAIVPRTI